MFLKKKLPLSMQGFTLIELVVIILLIGIISTIVLLEWPATSLNLGFEAKRLLNDIRYTQALSVTSGERYRWVRVSANSYRITNEAGTAVVLPSGGTQVVFSNGVSFGAFTNLPNQLIAFNSQGIPYVDTAIPGTALSALATIPLTAAGQTYSIQITPQTGYGTL